MSKVFRANPNCCPKCSEIDGKRFGDETEIYDISHPNCKCELEDEETDVKVPVVAILPAEPKPGPVPKLGGGYVAAVFDDEEEEEEMRKKKTKNEHSCDELEQIAMNDTLNEELYTGFTYTNPENGELPLNTEPTTYDFGSTLVMVSPVGTFLGSDAEGNPVPEDVTLEALKNVAANVSEEILVDVDHESEKIASSTKAAAWATSFRVIDNLNNLNGLYARLKWTGYGRKLVENREYRFLSPVWELDENAHPTRLISIALTNKPALKGISPIINCEPSKNPMSISNKLIKNNIMDKEILELVGISPVSDEVSPEEKETAIEIIKKWKEVSDAKDAEEIEKEKIEKEKVLMNEYDELVKDRDIDGDLFDLFKKDPEMCKQIVNACAKVKQEEPKKEEVAEVISKEALNSAPSSQVSFESAKDKAMKLHGQAFFDFISKHQNEF